MSTVPQRTIGRLSLYRRILRDLAAEKVGHAYSHVLAARAGVTAAQVRRDLMVIGYSGTPYHGYNVASLQEHIEAFLFPKSEQRVALAGVGNMGRAILAFFAGRRPKLRIVASFERNPEKCNRMIAGCPCYPIEDAPKVIRELGITVGIIAVPAEEAQYVANMFVNAGVSGIVNFARTPLRTPADVFVENIDLAMTMDKVAYFARHLRPRRTREELQLKENAS